MQTMVEKLAKERKEHIEHVEGMSFRDLKKMVSSISPIQRLKQRVNYVPRLRSKDELEAEVKIKRSWKDPGS